MLSEIFTHISRLTLQLLGWTAKYCLNLKREVSDQLQVWSTMILTCWVKSVAYLVDEIFMSVARQTLGSGWLLLLQKSFTNANGGGSGGWWSR